MWCTVNLTIITSYISQMFWEILHQFCFFKRSWAMWSPKANMINAITDTLAGPGAGVPTNCFHANTFSFSVDKVIYVTQYIVDDIIIIITITVFYNHYNTNVPLPKTFSKNWNIPWFKCWIAHDSQTEILYGLQVCSLCLIMMIYASDRCLQISM